MNMRVMWILVSVLTLIVFVFAWILFIVPAPVPAVENPTPATTTTPQQPTPSANAPLHDRVHVSSPKSGSTVGQSFDVTGEAPGNWYFEATFPIQVRDKDGNVLARGHANSQGEWMTEGQVPFVATVYLDSHYAGQATLILMKDNPSGLPEHDDSIEFQITVK